MMLIQLKDEIKILALIDIEIYSTLFNSKRPPPFNT